MEKEQLEAFIKQHNLVRHEEGGYFKVTYVAEQMVKVSDRYDGDERPASTKIDYLLAGNDFSAWHRIKSDETWRFKDGSSIILYVFSKTDTNQQNLLQIKIGDPKKEQDAVLEYTVEHDQWFAAISSDTSHFSFIECEVIPGFDYRDFELGKESDLIDLYPDYTDIIRQYARSVYANVET